MPMNKFFSQHCWSRRSLWIDNKFHVANEHLSTTFFIKHSLWFIKLWWKHLDVLITSEKSFYDGNWKQRKFSRFCAFPTQWMDVSGNEIFSWREWSMWFITREHEFRLGAFEVTQETRVLLWNSFPVLQTKLDYSFASELVSESKWISASVQGPNVIRVRWFFFLRYWSKLLFLNVNASTIILVDYELCTIVVNKSELNMLVRSRVSLLLSREWHAYWKLFHNNRFNRRIENKIWR